ncbi:MAG: sigma-70 family RNA polymerase sigma factor [Reichenbachiella sp.]|uniref:RNA polymerase sigma factor n=1 Tax=Reichenbachiella sp. TaxID=2184521 RepID=UPI003267448D
MKSETPHPVCEEQTFKFLFEKHATELHDFLYYKYGADNNPGDLVQEAFIKLWNNCKKVSMDRARSFLFTVANNQMLNTISRRKTVLNYQKEPHQMGSSESPEFVLEEKEYMNRLQSALESLSEDQRVTFLLNRVEGKKHKEIADLLGISRKAVEKRIYTALSILKSKVEGIK